MKFEINKTFPSPILSDFDAFLTYIETEKTTVTNANNYIAGGNLVELNAMMKSQCMEGLTNKMAQTRYPLLHIFYNIGKESELFTIDSTKKIAFLVPNKEKIAYYRSLNLSEQYLYLLKTIWVFTPPDELSFENDRHSNINVGEFLTTIKDFQANKIINTKIVFSNTNHLFGVLPFVEFFAAMGWCSIEKKLSDYSKFVYHLEKIMLTPIGAAFLEILEKKASYAAYNLEVEFPSFFLAIINSKITATEPIEEATIEEIQNFEALFNPILEEPSRMNLQIISEKEVIVGNYLIKVALKDDPKIWRTIKISSEDDFETLHLAIQSAFGFDNDHLYEFYLDNKTRNSKRTIEDPRSGGYSPFDFDENEDEDDTEEYEIETIGSEALTIGHKFAYIYDFGANWKMNLQVLEIEKDVPLAKEYSIVTVHGESPKEYEDDDDKEY